MQSVLLEHDAKPVRFVTRIELLWGNAPRPPAPVVRCRPQQATCPQQQAEDDTQDELDLGSFWVDECDNEI